MVIGIRRGTWRWDGGGGGRVASVSSKRAGSERENNLLLGRNNVKEGGILEKMVQEASEQGMESGKFWPPSSPSPSPSHDNHEVVAT